MNVSAVRDRFRFPDEPGVVELRAFTHGLQPSNVPAMMEHFTEDWRRFGVDAWNQVPNHWRPESGDRVGWWTLPSYLGDEFVAPLLGAPPGTCILQPNVHWSVQCLLSAPELHHRGREVVVSETAFPSVLHSVQQWGSMQDLEPKIVDASASGHIDRDGILQAISDDTALIALSQVGFTTGRRLQPSFLQTVAQKAKSHEALYLLDGYHAAGSMPVEVIDLGCDLYVGGLLKEGCGSSGNAFLFVDERTELSPHLTGWFGDAAPFSFQKSPEPHPETRRRFLGGTIAVAPLYHAVEGVRILLDVGLEAVREHSLRLTEIALARAEDIGLSVRSPTDRDERSAMVILEVPDAHRLTAYLKSHDVYTDSRRQEVVRMAPFIWNTEDEIHRAFDRIEDGLSNDTYRNATISAAGPVT